MFDPTSQGLVPNDHLSRLPPLPETPQHPTSPDSISAYFSLRKRESSAKQPEASIQKRMPIEPARVERDLKRSESTTSLRDYPVLSTRQSGTNIARNVSPSKSIHLPSDTSAVYASSRQRSPVKDFVGSLPNVESFSAAMIPLPETPAHPSRFLSTRPEGTNRNVSSSSFIFPLNGDLSLIGDCRPPSAVGFAEDSFDFGVEYIRPLTGRTARIRHRMPEIEVGPDSSGEVTPTKASPANSPLKSVRGGLMAFNNRLDRSTLLPSSPWHTDLLASTNALSRVQAPWADSSNTSPNNTEDSSDFLDTSSRLSPLKQSPRSVSNSKRHFPASSSSKSLAVVGEEDVIGNVEDQSALLPTSPDKLRHLLGPEHALKNEDMSLYDGNEGSHAFLPSYGAVRSTGNGLGGPSYVSSASRASTPRRTPRAARTAEPVNGDMTLDVKDLMAKMSKPKRASGTEESFIDLLRNAPNLEGIDESMMGADETFLPVGLRPTQHFPQQESPTNSQPPVHRSRSSHALATVSTPSRSMLPPDLVRKSRRRSKSMTESVDPYPDVPLSMRKTPTKTPQAKASITPRVRHGTTPAQMLSKQVPVPADGIAMPTHTSIKRLKPAAARMSVPRKQTEHVKQVPLTSEIIGAEAVRRPSVVSATVPAGLQARVRVGSIATVSSLQAPSRTTGLPRSKSSSATIVATASQPTEPIGHRPSVTTRTVVKPNVALPQTSGSAEGAPRVTRPSFRPISSGQTSVNPSARALPPSTARSESTREFGADAGRTTNRPTRTGPMTSGTVYASAQPIAKSRGTIGQFSSPSKSRALSTPASSVHTKSATTTLSSRLEGLRKGSVPAERMIKRPVSRIPAAGSATRGTASADIANLRARLDKLQARTAAAKK